MIKKIFNIILIFLIVVIQLTISPLDKVFLNLPIIFIIYFALYNFSLGWWWVILAGVFLDSSSLFNFPVFTLSFSLSFLLINFLARKLLSLNTFLSFLIFSFMGLIIYHLSFLFLNYFLYLLKIGNTFIFLSRAYFFNLLSSLIVNSIVICFLLILTKRLKNYLSRKL